jgi:hypothetical protein
VLRSELLLPPQTRPLFHSATPMHFMSGGVHYTSCLLLVLPLYRRCLEQSLMDFCSRCALCFIILGWVYFSVLVIKWLLEVFKMRRCRINSSVYGQLLRVIRILLLFTFRVRYKHNSQILYFQKTPTWIVPCLLGVDHCGCMSGPAGCR